MAGSDAFRRTQSRVAIAMAAGFVLTLAAFLWPGLPAISGDLENRIALWTGCSAAAGFWLFVAVGRLARHRFLAPEDIEGAGLAAGSPRARLLQALIQNTLEQTLLAVVAYGAWLFSAPPDRLGLVPVFALYFAVGRLLFFAGYARGAPARALGFALTFYPTVGLLLASLAAFLIRLAGG